MHQVGNFLPLIFLMDACNESDGALGAGLTGVQIIIPLFDWKHRDFSWGQNHELFSFLGAARIFQFHFLFKFPHFSWHLACTVSRPPAVSIKDKKNLNAMSTLCTLLFLPPGE